MTKKELLKKVAYLESLNDQLITELSYLDKLMRLVGFSEGLETVKATAQEILQKETRKPRKKKNHMENSG
jgi:hypothetical protein